MRHLLLVLILVGVFIIAGFLLLRPAPHQQPKSDNMWDNAKYDPWGQGDEGWAKWYSEYLKPGIDTLNRELAFGELKLVSRAKAPPPLPSEFQHLGPLPPVSWEEDPFYR